MVASAYLDTCLVSALAKGDIAASQMSALTEILCRFQRAEVSLVCSKAVDDELAAIPKDYRGPHIRQLRVFGEVPRADPGGLTRLSLAGGPGANPYRMLFDSLRELLPDAPDAEHVFVASSNRIDCLVTVDSRTMLRHKAAVRRLCGVQLMLPTEFLHAISQGS
jgi:hypothetical protein